jgi:hypothetical protein
MGFNMGYWEELTVPHAHSKSEDIFSSKMLDSYLVYKSGHFKGE